MSNQPPPAGPTDDAPGSLADHRAARYRLEAALLRIFDRCENWSPQDVKAAVADALGVTVAELEGRE